MLFGPCAFSTRFLAVHPHSPDRRTEEEEQVEYWSHGDATGWIIVAGANSKNE